ncbi:CAIB/BAIF family protein [Myriangium duriaei CBS 260.36]|uniref:CAIB/BAIF family protein n=1 Tax=Myriangium duriaei CBS 260.36 TaxID=1168546 RepID=A0A9P4J2B3_9PEZI|nr:CAIB/BAIF family protein [Myriangium duriaei CBS 260.36]
MSQWRGLATPALNALGTTSGLPLAGIKVLDLTRILAGPYATQMLGDLGASVTKIEDVQYGDGTRGWGPPYAPYTLAKHGKKAGESAYFLAASSFPANRNKKSVAIDFRHEAGRDLLYRMIKEADVLVENYVPGKLAKKGLDYETVSKINPRLIYASVTGYGQTGPYSKRAGFDVMVAAEMGMMHITGSRDGEPVKVGVAVTDLTTGMYTVVAVLSALWRRQITNRGQHIDMALSDVQVAMLANIASSHLISGLPDEGRWGTAHPSIVPYGGFKTIDGDIMLGGATEGAYKILCEKLNKPEWVTDPRFATNSVRVENRSLLSDMIEEITMTKTTEEWIAILEGSGMPYAPINNIEAVFKDPHVLARGMITEIDHPECGKIKLVSSPMKFSESPPTIRMAPPTLGQHTEEVLADLGITMEEVMQLRAAKTVA